MIKKSLRNKRFIIVVIIIVLVSSMSLLSLRIDFNEREDSFQPAAIGTQVTLLRLRFETHYIQGILLCSATTTEARSSRLSMMHQQEYYVRRPDFAQESMSITY